MSTLTFYPVQSIRLPQVEDAEWSRYFRGEDGTPHHPHPFHARMVAHVERLRNAGGGMVILDLPTGGGKTRALITHALVRDANALCIYPTNALKADQRRQMDDDIQRSGRAHKVVEVDGYSLAEYAEQHQQGRKGTALFYNYFAGFLGGLRIVLTNPDVFMLMMHGRYAMYQPSINEIARNYPVIAFDEAHTYDIKQLCALMHAARLLMEVQPFVFVFSTATVTEDMKRLLDDFPDDRIEIESIERQTTKEAIDDRQVLSRLDFAAVGVDDWRGGDWVKTNRNLIGPMADDGGCVVIFDSLAESLSLYKALCNEFSKPRVGLVVGPVHPKERPGELAKDIVVGNNAIRVGIDFVKRHALVYSRSGRDAIQGLGRVGRGKMDSAKAVLLAPPLTAATLNKAFAATSAANPNGVSRAQFNTALLKTHPVFEKFAAYSSRYGVVEASAVQEATEICRPHLFPTLFKVTEEQAAATYGSFSKRMLGDLVNFRGSEPFSLAVYDEDMKREGLFPFHFDDVYRVFRWCEIYPLSAKVLDELLDGSGQEYAATFRREIRERRKRKDIVGYAKVRVRSSPRSQVAFTNVHLPQPALKKGELRYGKGWAISVNLPQVGCRVRDYACENMQEQAITYLIFDPATRQLPPLFKYYPLLEAPNLCVAFGHNAFLLNA
jgi:CRISPR-associated helicase Cas3